ncbi:hypothetical protein WJX77_008630 [Trebouxia sp. C0004]
MGTLPAQGTGKLPASVESAGGIGDPLDIMRSMCANDSAAVAHQRGSLQFSGVLAVPETVAEGQKQHHQ